MTLIFGISKNEINFTINECARIIRSGGTVVFPTETVYGLGADAFNPEACKKIFAAKNRPADNPLIVHISSIDSIDKIAYIDDDLKHIMERVWPSPLTLLLKKKPGLPDTVTAGLDTVCVRFPDNDIALRLISEAGPIAAPSANISTKPSIVDSDTAIRELEGRVDAIIDAGRVIYGLESTIIDCTKKPYEMLRAGAFSREDLDLIFGKIYVSPLVYGNIQSDIALTPGLKYRHYAPDKKLILIENDNTFRNFISSEGSKNFLSFGSQQNGKYAKYSYVDMGNNIYEVAHNLFYDFRMLDSSDKLAGAIQQFDEQGMGLAVMNRIRKASFATIKDKENIDRIYSLINEA
ncbi:MAG: L-threonylcarbamoyladenylate synthase [Ferroplasma sp.]